MVDSSPVTIGLIGMPPSEERRLRAAFEYSKDRHTSYTDSGLDASPDILMVRW